MSACVPSSESISSLEVAHKTVEVADDVSIRLAYKDFYIIRAGACDYTGQTQTHRQAARDRLAQRRK